MQYNPRYDLESIQQELKGLKKQHFPHYVILWVAYSFIAIAVYAIALEAVTIYLVALIIPATLIILYEQRAYEKKFGDCKTDIEARKRTADMNGMVTDPDLPFTDEQRVELQNALYRYYWKNIDKHSAFTKKTDWSAITIAKNTSEIYLSVIFGTFFIIKILSWFKESAVQWFAQ